MVAALQGSPLPSSFLISRNDWNNKRLPLPRKTQLQRFADRFFNGSRTVIKRIHRLTAGKMSVGV